MEKLSFQSKPRKPFSVEIDGNTFEIVRRVPGTVFIEFVSKLKGLQTDGTSANLTDVGDLGDTIQEMFEAIMEPEEFGRFWKWSKSVDGPDFDVLVEVLGSLVTEDTGRPTSRPTSSRRGPRRTGPSSTEN